MGYAGHSPPDVIKLGRVVRFLAALPAAQRFAVLKQWMLPSQPGAEPRAAMCYAPLESPPELFFAKGKQSQETAVSNGAAAASVPLAEQASPGTDGVICFSELLVAAAAESGKLEELAKVAKASTSNPHMADTISILTAFALQRDRDQLAKQADAIIESWQPSDQPGGRSMDQERPRPWSAHMIARAWLRSATFRSQGKQLAGLLQDYAVSARKRSLLSCIQRDLATCRVQECGGTLTPGTDPGLALWHSGGYYFASGSPVGTWPAWWVADKGTIVQLSGPEVDPLYFDYPLSGTFELSVDAYCNVAAEAAVEFGRFLFEPFWRSGKARMLIIGQREMVDRDLPEAECGRFNQLVIRVSPESVQYLCNGTLVYEDQDPSPTTPWLALLGRGTRTTAWRNLKLTGTPRVPQQVPLIDGERMEGWMSALYRGRVPRQLRAAGQGASRATASAAARRYTWYAADSVLHGPRVKSFKRDMMVQSWLAYHRSLRDGDTLSYEFFYQPGEKMVHPSLGRMALMLEPDGVRLHWITDIPHISVGDLSVDNTVTIAASQRGLRPLPLLADQWNRVTIAVTRDAATVALNGTEIYVHRLSATSNRMFGFFRYSSQTTAEVRRITLQGDWPQSLTDAQMAHPAVRSTTSKANQPCRAALVREVLRAAKQ